MKTLLLLHALAELPVEFVSVSVLHARVCGNQWQDKDALGHLAARHFESVTGAKDNGGSRDSSSSNNDGHDHNGGGSGGNHGDLLVGEEGEREQTNGAFTVLTAVKVKRGEIETRERGREGGRE